VKSKPSWANWAKTRERHLATYPECRICGTLDEIVVHHLVYRGPRGQSELSGDLVTLCKSHHDELHASLGRTPPREKQWAFIGVPKVIAQDWMATTEPAV
jgi:5-methylcytosine-specific restriction endonuclease McrA